MLPIPWSPIPEKGAVWGKPDHLVVAITTKAEGGMLKTKKTPRRKLIEKLDYTCSQITKGNAGGLCEICGKAGAGTHHFFGKHIHGSIRWDLNNLLYLCFACHIRKVHQQGDTEQARDVLIKRIGLPEFLALKALGDKTIKYSANDMADLLIALEGKLVALKGK